jgi:hypothetical protein
VVSNFVVISVMVAAVIMLAEPAGKSSIVTATSRAGGSAALELNGTVPIHNAQAVNRNANFDFMQQVSGQGRDEAAKIGIRARKGFLFATGPDANARIRASKFEEH